MHSLTFKMKKYETNPHWDKLGKRAGLPSQKYQIQSSHCSSAGNKPNKYPWGCRFNPWPHSVGQGFSLAVSCGVGHRCSSDPTLLWLWCSPAATAPIQPLTLGTSMCLRCGPKKNKKQNQTKSTAWDILICCMNHPSAFLKNLEGIWDKRQKK